MLGSSAYSASHIGHGATRLVFQCRALSYPLGASIDKGFDILGGSCTPSSQRARLADHYCMSTPLLAGTYRLYCEAPK